MTTPRDDDAGQDAQPEDDPQGTQRKERLNQEAGSEEQSDEGGDSDTT